MMKSESVSHENRKTCGARARTNGYAPCQKPPLVGKTRCALHGGKCTGAKTPEGKLRAAQAPYKHGRYTKEAKAERARMRELMKWREDLNEVA